MARKALGKGLGALIPGGGPAPAELSGGGAGGIQWVQPAAIEPNRRQPRADFDEPALEELAASVRALGVLQPLIVRRAAGGLELVAGERRLRAAKRAGLTSVPVLVREASEQESLEMALVENLQRSDLSPVEEATGYQQLAEKFGLSQGEIAKRVGRSRSAVANTLRLLGLPEEVRAELGRGALSAGHARVLVGLEDRGAQLRAARQIIQRRLSVRQAEGLYQGAKARLKGARKGDDAEIKAVARRLSEALGTRVRVKGDGEKGRIEIEYYSGAQLGELVGHLGSGRF